MSDEDVEQRHLEVTLQNIRMALNGEQARVAFIRQAAIAFYTTLHESFSYEECWGFARELWDAKPEDC
jgi:hypothetical protein